MATLIIMTVNQSKNTSKTTTTSSGAKRANDEVVVVRNHAFEDVLKFKI